MKNNILKYFILTLSLLAILIVYLSTIGVETEKFNDQIKNRISQINKNIDLDLKKINNDRSIIKYFKILFFI